MIFGRGGYLEFPFPVAVKTGTSQAYHDNWTVGYTREVTVGVWVGNFDRSPLRASTGVTGAAPIFHAVMLAASRRVPPAATESGLAVRPADLSPREICALSGMPAHPWCPSRRHEDLPGGDDPPCSWHHLSDQGLETIWPAQYRQWAKQQGLVASPSADAVPVTRADRTAPHRQEPSGQRRVLEIANPPSGAVYSIDPTMRREFQTLSLRASGPRRGRITWDLNGRSLGTSSSDRAFEWPLTPGRHRFRARDEQGGSAETAIVVK